MKEYIRYLPTLNSLLFKQDYIYMIADEMSRTKTKNLRTAMGPFYVKEDGTVSRHPQSKFEKPGASLVRSIIENHDPSFVKLSAFVAESLPYTVMSADISRPHYLEILHSLYSTECIRHYPHHGDMLDLTQLDSEVVRLLIGKVTNLIKSININTTSTFHSSYLNAQGKVNRYPDHGAVFVTKHKILIYVYTDGRVAMCLHNTTAMFELTDMIVNAFNTLKEQPDNLMGATRKAVPDRQRSFDYIIYNNEYIDGNITVDDMLTWNLTGPVDITHNSIPITTDNIKLCFNKNVCVLGTNNKELLAWLEHSAKSVNTLAPNAKLLN